MILKTLKINIDTAIKLVRQQKKHYFLIRIAQPSFLSLGINETTCQSAWSLRFNTTV